MALNVIKTKAVNDGGGSSTANSANKKKAQQLAQQAAAKGIAAYGLLGGINTNVPTVPKAAAPAQEATTPKTPAASGNSTAAAVKPAATPTKTTTTKKSTPAPVLELPELAALPNVGNYGTRPTYQQSPAVTQAYNAYMQYLNSKPPNYQSRYQPQIDSLLNQILNRPAFEYDFTTDPMYHAYSDMYTAQGKAAMQDTMAQAAALTGGYGNSYAATAGQQAYANELQNLNAVIPELWNMAYNVYRDEGDSMRANMGLLQGLENTDYSRYRDDVSDWQTDRAFAWNAYNTEYDRDYGMYRDRVGDWESDRSFNYAADLAAYDASVAQRDFAYNRYLNELDERNRAEEFAYRQTQDALAQENYMREWDYAIEQDRLAQAARSSGGGSSGSSKSSSNSDSAARGITDGAVSFSGATGGVIGDRTADELEELAIRMWQGSGTNSNPYQALERNTSLSAAQKAYVKEALDDLNDSDINVGYYRG